MKQTTANYDEPWKEALTEYFSPRKRVSWRNPFSVEETRFLDFKTKKRFADKLYLQFERLLLTHLKEECYVWRIDYACKNTLFQIYLNLFQFKYLKLD